VRLQAAAEAVDGLKAQYAGLPIVAKIDCEGAEYEILEALAAAGRVREIETYLIEWHGQGPAPLVEILAGSAFRCFCPRESAGLGMVYAVRA
jgi:hypothetical protein